MGGLAALCGHSSFCFDDECREPLVLLLCAMAVEDGQAADEELSIIEMLLGECGFYSGERERFERWIKASLAVIDSEVFGAGLRGALGAFQRQESREVLAVMLSLVAEADGVASRYEDAFCEALFVELGVSADRMKELRVCAVEPYLSKVQGREDVS